MVDADRAQNERRNTENELLMGAFLWLSVGRRYFPLHFDSSTRFFVAIGRQKTEGEQRSTTPHRRSTLWGKARRSSFEELSRDERSRFH